MSASSTPINAPMSTYQPVPSAPSPQHANSEQGMLPPPANAMTKTDISRAKVIFLALGMVITGSMNTLSTKKADVSRAQDTWDTRDEWGDSPQFNHPLVQAAGMFLGESFCLLAYLIYVYVAIKKNQPYEKPAPGFNYFLFALPACCDLTGTSMMYIGLTYTYASVFQMLRGAVIVFTGVLSVLFLKRQLKIFHWIGMGVILGGLATVGISSLGDSNSNATNPVLGDILVVSAQLITAFQMVVEERFLDKYNVPPLMAVGLEGVFGFVIMCFLMVPFYYIPVPISTDRRMENALDAFVQLGNSWTIIVATLGNIFSIAFFNYFGVSVTKNLSATTRMVLDSVRTIIIWGVSLMVGWQDFSYLQIIGFTILITGTAIYYQYLNYGQFVFMRHGCKKVDTAVLDETPIQHVTGYTQLDDQSR